MAPQLNRKLRRTETDWVVVEHKSVAAYNAHRSQILDLARGEGTEILASSHETSARSVILKVRILRLGQKIMLTIDKFIYSSANI